VCTALQHIIVVAWTCLLTIPWSMNQKRRSGSDQWGVGFSFVLSFDEQITP
jgi:hypothetical protein